MADITLSAATRSNLLSLNRTTDLIDRTQDRLSTGKKVNSAVDDALSFFKARSFSDRAGDLATIKNNINEAINVITTATNALENAEDVLKQMKAVAEAARAESSATNRGSLATQFFTLTKQLNGMLKDATYNGVNLLLKDAYEPTASSTNPSNLMSPALSELSVTFSAVDDDRKLDITGANFATNYTSLGSVQQTASDSTLVEGTVYGVALNAMGETFYIREGPSAGKTIPADGTNNWTSGQSTTSKAIAVVDSALQNVRSKAAEFGRNAALLEIRKDFTDNMINTLEQGAGQLVNADMNAESANMTSLQTRQQLGVISLSIAQQSEQAVLRLF